MYDTVLVPTDGSEPADRAVDHALTLADRYGAGIHALYCVETHRYGEPALDVHVLTDLPDATVNVLQREADVVVQKSLREGFGLVVSEALWKRTPVVGSTVGGIPLQVEDGHDGDLVEPNDVPGVADGVVALLEDERLRTSFGANGRERVRERFLLPRQLADLLEVLETVLDLER